uniref:CD109 antigen n=4 Tax=Lygus hesperus TaxID=30085 RepID=A0A0A9YF98_LYGHE
MCFGASPNMLAPVLHCCTSSIDEAGVMEEHPQGPVLPPVVVRSAFPETWLWNFEDVGPQGKTSVRKVVPDTITSWVITGFSLSPEFGLGLSDDPTQVRVFRPFFISLNLPYSVTREESMLLPINVFNYMDQELKVEVTLENPGWFNFAPPQVSPTKKKKFDSDSARVKTVVVAPKNAATVNFAITPKQVGYLEVKAVARSALAGDGITRKLLVKPEGETQYRTKGILVDLRTKKDFMLAVALDIPTDIVPDSELIEVSLVGDLLGAALENLDKLIRQPYGCGEQNMLNFVPNIVILDYLKASNLLTNSIQQKALKYLELGYQRELTYKHKDNSYSAFGEGDKNGSTWLTAFVAKSFKQAQKFIDIESSAIIEPLRWLAAKQTRNGSFPEVGQVWHKQMQGGGSNGLALTAYVLTAFVESMSLTDEFKDTIDRAARFVNEQIEKSSVDTYSLAVTSYALNFAGHPASDKAFSLLESKSQTEGESKWWIKDMEKDKEREGIVNPWETCIPNAINVEVTAYVMLSYLYRNMYTEALPILRWLLAQQNGQGGFASTQDTVVALGAIAKLAKKIVGQNKDMSVAFEYPPGDSTKLKLNQDNAMVLQKAELHSKKVRTITVDAKGTGLGIVHISYRYNVNKKGDFPLFNLAPKVEEASTKDHLILAVTLSFAGGKESNMAVMEVTLPSGFTIDDEGLKALKMTDKIKKVETKDDDTVVILYFDKVTSESMCPVISAYKSFKIAKQRPVPVTIYDYYDNSRRATEFYSPMPSEICDICDADDCQHIGRLSQ